MKKRIIKNIFTAFAVAVAVAAITFIGFKAEAKIPASLNEYFASKGDAYTRLSEQEKKRYDEIADMNNLYDGLTYIGTDCLHAEYAYMYDHPVYEFNKIYISSIDTYWEHVDPVIRKASQIAQGAQGAQHEKAKYLHDYICNNVSYSTTAENCDSAYGALIKGVAKCTGYADAYALLCQLADIPCYRLTSGRHAWNIVKLEDGEWYEVDCTNDDGTDSDGTPKIWYTRFFLPTEEVREGTAYDRNIFDKKFLPIARGTKFAHYYDPNYQDDKDEENDTDLELPVELRSPVIKKITVKGKSLTLKWEKASGINGYEIQYSTDKKFKKGVKKIDIKKTKTTSKTIKKLKSKKKYYVRLRFYEKRRNIKIYSKWSKVKKVKIK